MTAATAWIRRLFGFAVMVVSGCALAPLEDEQAAGEPEPQRIGQISQPLSSLDCTMSSATGYVDGTPFTIKVVTVDGKKVEWKTANAYMKMAKAAAGAGVEIRVISGFRTMAEQQYLYNCFVNCNCNNCNLAAKPGYSNHQSGHALDLNTSSSGVYTWLGNNAGRFGFKRTVPSEIWHWEWWGTDDGTGPCNDQDKDNDGVTDAKDNCPSVKNGGQTDTDNDGKGDACDGDDDGDGIGDANDNCPKKANAGQADTDGDGKGNACDADNDNDTITDDKDNCPNVANKGQLDTDKDGKGDACDTDDDGDGIADTGDNCPKKANAGQLDSDGDGKGDACALDDDGDGFADADDNCPKLANPEQENADADAQGDACDTDDDGDGALDTADNCPLAQNADQSDTDQDGTGDVCDLDNDGDGVPDLEDVCPAVSDPEQIDLDEDGQGDACDDDDDGDGVPDATDQCPGVPDGDLSLEECGGSGETTAEPESDPGSRGSTSEGDDGGCRIGRARSPAFPLAVLLVMAALALRRRRGMCRTRDPATRHGTRANPCSPRVICR